MNRTHSIESAVLQICGPDSGMKDPRGWVIRQIRAGRFHAYKIGRSYRMSQAQIDAALESLSSTAPVREPVAPKPHGISLTATSARRLKAVAP